MKFFAPVKLSENMRETPEGFLLCLNVPICRTGEMIYGKNETPLEPGPDGKVKIYRRPEEVFRPATIASFNGKAFTVTHPEEFVTVENWAQLAKGIIQNARKSEENDTDVVADVLITDKMTIGLVKEGHLREVSCGYEADYVQIKPGEGEQKNIIGNHLALVDQGRAGSSYAINDHKEQGDDDMKNAKELLEKLKAIVADAAEEKPAEESKEKKVGDQAAYDELVKMVADIGEMVKGLVEKKAGDAEGAAASGQGEVEKKEKPAGDEDPMATIESRLKALEEAMSKLLDMEAAEASQSGDEEQESEDDDYEESSMVGDSAAQDTLARAEILAPGIKASKNVKAEALKQAYGTEEGKKIIHTLTGGKAPAFDSAEKVDVIFAAASELMKATRKEHFARTKGIANDTSAGHSAKASGSSMMTPEQLNEMNAKYYNRVN